MNERRRYFFCGIGGSGMAPLAMILLEQGHVVEGSDRSLDQGRTGDKFDALRARGVALFPQDGSGVTHKDQIFVASAAVEDTVPDVQAAKRLGAHRLTRAELLAKLFNAAPTSIGVAGTSGKSTTTGMAGWILHHLGRAPTIMNGAVMKNFMSPENPVASALVGDGGVFVSEVDESDGSIAGYNPTIAVLNNVALDHKSLEELRSLFGDFVGRAETAVLNLDNAETAAIAASVAHGKAITYSLDNPAARLRASNVAPAPDGIAFDVCENQDASTPVRLRVPGRHNVENALAALAIARACGATLGDAAAALGEFRGLRRRLEIVGEANGVIVIDDFAHNPDKITATLETLHTFPGRLLVMFQPHGFGPLKLLKDAFIECFAKQLHAGDVLIMPEPVYFGGTVDRAVSSGDITTGVVARDRQAETLKDRDACGDRLFALARRGDRIVIMGARDDTLSTFAEKLLARLAASEKETGAA